MTPPQTPSELKCVHEISLQLPCDKCTRHEPDLSPSELDKAIDECEQSWIGLDPVYDDLRIVVNAAKRLKEVEKERDEFIRTEPLKVKERDYWRGLIFDLIQVFPHSEEETEGEVIARMVKELQDLSTLRTEYKNALDELSHYLSGLRCAFSASQNLPTCDSFSNPEEMWCGICKHKKRIKNILSTPHAIAAMKKGEV